MHASLLPTTPDDIPQDALARAREICQQIDWLEHAWVARMQTTSSGPEPKVSESLELFLWLGENQYRLHYDQRMWPGTDEPIGGGMVIAWVMPPGFEEEQDELRRLFPDSSLPVGDELPELDRLGVRLK
jgi:hypothetical protein